MDFHFDLFVSFRNGPTGVFEMEKFAAGSKAALNSTIEAAKKGATVIVGGGDTATLVARKHISFSSYFFRIRSTGSFCSYLSVSSG